MRGWLVRPAFDRELYHCLADTGRLVSSASDTAADRRFVILSQSHTELITRPDSCICEARHQPKIGGCLCLVREIRRTSGYSETILAAYLRHGSGLWVPHRVSSQSPRAAPPPLLDFAPRANKAPGPQPLWQFYQALASGWAYRGIGAEVERDAGRDCYGYWGGFGDPNPPSYCPPPPLLPRPVAACGPLIGEQTRGPNSERGDGSPQYTTVPVSVTYSHKSDYSSALFERSQPSV